MTKKEQEKEKVAIQSGYSVNKIISLVENMYLANDGREAMPSILLLGRSGIGKTVGVMSLAKRLAEKTGRVFVDLRQNSVDYEELIKNPEKYFIFYGFALTHVEPTDLSGVMRPRDDYAVFLPPEYVKLLSSPKSAGVLFLDEITTDPRIDRRSAEMKILDERQFGYKTISNRVLIMCAGNTDKDTSMAAPLPDPILRGRVSIFNVSPPSVEEWVQYMDQIYGDRWEKLIGAFLMRWKNLLWKQYSSDEGFEPRNAPRAWTKLAIQLFYIKKDDEQEMVVRSWVDSETVPLLLSFLRTAVPSLEEITPDVWRKLETDARYIVVSMMSQRKPDELIERFRELLVAVSEDAEYLELLRVLLGEKAKEFLLKVQRYLPSVFSKFWDTHKRGVTEFGV